MKAAPFDYIRATSLDEAMSLLADRSIESRLIAGGQTLVPLMAMRLARPERLIDISELSELKTISESGDRVRIGATVRQRDAERSPVVQAKIPLLATSLEYVGHQQTRNRGTIGGSLCNADPTAEIVLTAITLEATLNIASARGTRQIGIAEFVTDAMETALADDECLVSVDFPVWSGESIGHGFVEVNARASDYAIVAAAAQVVIAGGRCSRIHASVGGASAVALRARDVEKALALSDLNDDEVNRAAASITSQLNPVDDTQASGFYRKRVAGELLARAIQEARNNAGLNTSETSR